MRCIKSRSFAAINAALLALFCYASLALAAKRPHYGGTLRLELHATSISLDPRQWKPGSLATAENEKLAALVYDRLISLDEFGRFHPALASEWMVTDNRFWYFKLRSGVKFSDGSALTPSDVLASLQNELPPGTQITASDSGVSITPIHSNPDLLMQLATGNSFIYRVQTKGVLLGTGPFHVVEMSPAGTDSNLAFAKPAHIRFRANEETWSGRPFLDSIEVTLGVPQLRQLLDLQLGKVDLVEVAPELVRKARQENLRIWRSSPNTLLALRFDDKQAASGDARLRQALSLSLDRETMANVLLQRQAEPAASLLPQWLSGYSFLFDHPMDVQLAKEMRQALPANLAAGKDPLRMRLDASGDLMKLLGERVAVNARQANIMIQVLPRASELPLESAAAANASTQDLHLIAWHYETVSPSRELEALLSQLHLQENVEGAHAGSDASPSYDQLYERLYERERRFIENRRILPLVILPEYAGLGANVRNWLPASWGEWRLAEVWLDPNEKVSTLQDDDAAKNPNRLRAAGVRP